MAKTMMIVFLIVPICALCLLFLVQAERMIMEERERTTELRASRSMGGVSRRDMRRATAQAMRTDARMEKMHARYLGRHDR